MSNAGQVTNKLATMSITGNPTVDTVIRYGLVAAAGLATGAITGWLNREGFHDPNLVYYVGSAVAAVLGGFAMAIWGAIRTSKNEYVIKFREAIAVQAGIAAEAAPNPTPVVTTIADAQKIIADHAPEPGVLPAK